ncbi:hypothetical protein BD560DRAFT_494091 [Blakeslea trispora]|nr:hypothetical protein BD560DRAFT_494091 [Blakeslea trispora]
MTYTPLVTLSLKRNRSDITENLHEALNKVMTLRSKLAKLSKKISQSMHASSEPMDVFHLFRFASHEIKHRPTYESDELYEHKSFYKSKRFKLVDNVDLNCNHSKHLTSILVKNSRCNEHQSNLPENCFTMRSENLTAKEFADIAGITILPENEREFTSLDEDHLSALNMDTLLSSKSYTLRRPQIWDSDFWSRPNDNLHRSNTRHDSIPSTLVESIFALQDKDLSKLHLTDSKVLTTR